MLFLMFFGMVFLLYGNCVFVILMGLSFLFEGLCLLRQFCLFVPMVWSLVLGTLAIAFVHVLPLAFMTRLWSYWRNRAY